MLMYWSTNLIHYRGKVASFPYIYQEVLSILYIPILLLLTYANRQDFQPHARKILRILLFFKYITLFYNTFSAENVFFPHSQVQIMVFHNILIERISFFPSTINFMGALLVESFGRFSKELKETIS